jgi:diguanylate cyclase (GGDEF)-like protein
MCRGYDYVALMGGDEFVVVAPGLKPEAAEEKASRLNQLATESGRKIAGRNLIALSVGTAFCPEDGFDLEHLLAAADRRMYSVKQIHHEEIDNETRPPDSRSRGATVN